MARLFETRWWKLEAVLIGSDHILAGPRNGEVLSGSFYEVRDSSRNEGCRPFFATYGCEHDREGKLSTRSLLAHLQVSRMSERIARVGCVLTGSENCRVMSWVWALDHSAGNERLDEAYRITWAWL
jgi:hypothetical protein